MTNKQVNYQVNFNPNTTALKGALRSLQKDLAAITSKPITFDSGQLKAAVNDAKQLNTILQQSTNLNTGKLDLSKFSSQLQASSKTLQQYGVSLQQLGPKGQQAFLKLAKSISQAEVPLRKTNTLVSKLWISLKNVASWQISSSLLTGLISGISNAVNYAKDLNESLNNIRIVSGKSAMEMEAFAEKANKAAKALSTTTTAYTDAALIYYQQGLSAKEVEERTKATIKMANVTGESAEAVSSYMTAIWNNFDDGTKSLEYYADAMAKLGAATASSTDEIAAGLEKFIGIAETVGLSYEYATSALATLTAETRQSAETVGTALKTIFSRLQGLSLGETLEDGTTLNKYSEALATIGVQIKEQDGSLKSMDKILDDLGKKWNFLAQDQKMALAQTVGGVRQYTQLITLMDNYEDFKINIDLATNAEGTLNEQNRIFEESWEASSKRVKASLEDIWDDILDDDFFIELNNGLSGLIDSVGALLKGFGGIKNIVGMITPMIVGKLLPSIMNTGAGISNIFKNAVGKNSVYSPLAQNQASQQAIQKQLNSGDLSASQQQQHQLQLELLRTKELELKFSQSMTNEQREAIKVRQDALTVEQQILDKLLEQQRVMQGEADNAIRKSTGHVQNANARKDIRTEYQNLEENLRRQYEFKNLGLVNTDDRGGSHNQTGEEIINNLKNQGDIKNFADSRMLAVEKTIGISGVRNQYERVLATENYQNWDNKVQGIATKEQELETNRAVIQKEYDRQANIANNANQGSNKQKNAFKRMAARQAELDAMDEQLGLVREEKNIALDNRASAQAKQEALGGAAKVDSNTRTIMDSFFSKLDALVQKINSGADLDAADMNNMRDLENDALYLSQTKLENEEAMIRGRLTDDLGVDSQNVDQFVNATETGFKTQSDIDDNINNSLLTKEKEAKIIRENAELENKLENQRHANETKNREAEGKTEQKNIKENAQREQAANKETAKQKEKQQNKKPKKETNLEDDSPSVEEEEVKVDTTSAQAELDNLEAKEEGEPITKKIDGDTAPAEADADAFKAKEEGKPIKKSIDINTMAAQERMMQLTQTVQTFATGLTGVSMAISSIQSLGSIWSNDDLSLGEKITASVGSFAAIISSAAMILPLFTVAKKKDAAATMEGVVAEQTGNVVRNKTNKSIFKSIATLFTWGRAKDAEQGRDKKRRIQDVITGFLGETKKGFPAMLPGMLAIAAVATLGGISLAGAISSASSQKQQETNTKTIEKYNEGHEKTTQTLETQKSFNELYKKFEETGQGVQELAKEARNTAKELGISGAEAKILAGNFKDLNTAITDKAIETLKDDQKQNETAQAAAQANLLAIARKGDGLLADGEYQLSSGAGLWLEKVDEEVARIVDNGEYNFLKTQANASSGQVEQIYANANPENLVALYDEISKFITEVQNSDIEDYNASEFYKYYSNWLNKEGLAEAVETLRTLQNTEKEQELQLDLLNFKKDNENIENYEDYLKFYKKMQNAQKDAKYSTEELNAALMVDLDTSKWESVRQGIEDLTKETGVAKQKWEELYNTYGNAIFTAKIEPWMDDEQLEKEVEKAQDLLNSKEITVQLQAVYSDTDSFIKARKSGDIDALNEWFAKKGITTDAEKTKILNMTDEEFEEYIKGNKVSDFQKSTQGKTVGAKEDYEELNNLEKIYNEEHAKYEEYAMRDKDLQFIEIALGVAATAKKNSKGKEYKDSVVDNELIKALDEQVELGNLDKEYVDSIKQNYKNFGEKEFVEYVQKLLAVYWPEVNFEDLTNDEFFTYSSANLQLFQSKREQYDSQFDNQKDSVNEAYDNYSAEKEKTNVYNSDDLFNIITVASQSSTIAELLQAMGSAGRDTPHFWNRLNELAEENENTLVTVQEYQREYQNVLKDISLSEEERAKKLKEIEKKYDSILIAETKIQELRDAGAEDILSKLEADERGEEELTSSERKALYAQLAKTVNDAYGTSYTGQDIETNPELLKAIKNIIWGVDSVKEYTQSLLQIWSNPEVLNVKLDLQDQEKAEKLAVLMGKIDDVDNEIKLKEVFIEMAKLLEKDFSKLIELLATLMGIEISDETLAALKKFGSLMGDGKINLDTELNGTDDEGSPIFSSEDKEGYLGWLKDQELVTDDDVSYDEENDEIKIEGSNADGSITAVLEDPSNYLGYLLGDATLGKMMSFLVGGGSISNNEAITKDNIAEKAKLPDDPAQYDDLADKLKKAKDLYPKLTREFNKYIDALRKGNATQEDFQDFLDAINSENNIEDYADSINKAADAFKVLNDETSSAREKADAREDITDSLDDIFNTDVFDEEFVKNNADAVYGFLEDGTKSPKFKQFLQGYYKKLKEDFDKLNLQDTTWISSDGMAIDIPIDFEVNTKDLEEKFGSLQGFADQAQAAFDQLTGPEPSTEGLTALIGSLLQCGVSAADAGAIIGAFAASVPGTLSTKYIIDIVQRFSQEGMIIDINSMLTGAGASEDFQERGFDTRDSAKSYLTNVVGLGELDAEAILQGAKFTRTATSGRNKFYITTEGMTQVAEYMPSYFGIDPQELGKGFEPIKFDFNGKDFNTAAEETEFQGNEGGGGGGQDTTPDKKVKKYNAELEKTKIILENIGKECEKLEKLSDSYLATDEDRLVNLIGLNNNLNEQLDLYNDMKTQGEEALPDAKKEMEKWVKEAGFAEADLQYDQEGRIINLPKLIQEMDHKIADAPTGDAQSELEEAKGLMEEGIENFNEIVEALVDAEMGILDTSIEISKNNLEQITLPFEIFSRRTEQERKNVETYLGWLEDVNGKSIDRLNYRSKTSLSILEEYGANEDKINTLLSTGLTTQAQRDALEEALNHKLELRTSLLEEQKAIIEEVGSYLEEHNEYIDRFYDTFDRINSLLDTYKSVMEVVGKNIEEHQAINLKISDTQIKNSQMQLRAAKATKEAAQATYNAVKKAYDNAVASGDETLISHWEEQLWSAEGRLNEAADNFQSAWTDSLDLILERYELAVEQTILRFEDSLSPQKTLDEKNKLYENLLEESDRFLTNEERVYELNKINRQINQEMSKNPNILVQQKLLGIQELINKLKKDEANITDYQLSKLQKIYDLRLAEIALEEAQNNKTQARLVRNSQGNWNYVFTADQGQIDQAAQQLEDARYNYYNNAKEQADKLSKEILDNEKNLSEALKNIKREDYTSEEEYRKALDDTAKYYLNRDAYLRAQMDEALYDSGQSYEDSVLGQIEGYESLDAAHQNLETATKTAINEMVSHFATFEEEVKNTMTEAGEDYDTFVDKLDTSLDSITSWSETASTNVSNACKTMVDSFQTVIDKAIEFAKAVNLEGMTTEEFNEMIKTDSNSAFDKTYNTPFGHANTDYTGLALKLYETYGEDAIELIEIVNQMRNQKISSGLYDTKDATYMSTEEFLNYVKSNSAAGSNALGKNIELDLSKEIDNDIQNALNNLIDNSGYFDATKHSQGVSSSASEEENANFVDRSNIVNVTTGEKVTEQQLYDALSSPGLRASFKLNDLQVNFTKGPDGSIYGTSEHFAGIKSLDEIKAMAQFKDAFNPDFADDLASSWSSISIEDPQSKYLEKELIMLLQENKDKYLTLSKQGYVVRVFFKSEDNTVQAVDEQGNPLWWSDVRENLGYSGEGYLEWLEELGINRFDTGGYTGDWNSKDGKLAMLHEKEIVLNKADTKNLLSAVEVLRGMSTGIAGMLLGNAGHQMNGLARAINVATIGAQDRTLQQQVHIDATFPGVTSAFEIETALNNIINDVSQYAEIKKF